MRTIEADLTRRASRIPVEEVYTDELVDPFDTVPSVGYRFDFPNSWLNEYGANKMISPRKLLVTPRNHAFEFAIHYSFDLSNNPGMILKLFYVVDENVTVEEWLALLLKDFRRQMEDPALVFPGEPDLQFEYDYKTGSLKFRIVRIGQLEQIERANMKFVFEPNAVNGPNFVGFARFLNQRANRDTYNILTEYSEEITLTDVWNRQPLFVHSNISTSRHQFIGMSRDFWPQPNKLFSYNHGMSDFNIRFTTDGKNCIIPKHAKFVIELSFIVNFDTVKVL